jgi:hypothetical protein
LIDLKIDAAQRDDLNLRIIDLGKVAGIDNVIHENCLPGRKGD